VFHDDIDTQLCHAEALILNSMFDQSMHVLQSLRESTNLSRSQLGQLHFLIGLYYTRVQSGDEGLLSLEKAILVFTESQGPNHPQTIRAMNQRTSCLYFHALKVHDAESVRKSTEWAELCMTQAEVALGSDHPLTLDAKDNLSRCLHAQGDYIRAISIMDEVIHLSNTVLGPQHPVLALRYSIMGGLLYTGRAKRLRNEQMVRREMNKMASEWVEMALDMAHVSVGVEHALYAYCLEWFCIAYRLDDDLTPDEVECVELLKQNLNSQARTIRLNTGTRRFDSGI